MKSVSFVIGLSLLGPGLNPNFYWSMRENIKLKIRKDGLEDGSGIVRNYPMDGIKTFHLQAFELWSQTAKTPWYVFERATVDPKDFQ